MQKYLVIFILTISIFTVNVQAQKKNVEIKIKTSAQCEMCKTRIETAMAFEKGVDKSVLDVETKELTVYYKPGKTTPEKIRKAVNAVGYDADDTMADPKAYSDLPACCKKPDDPDHIAH